MRRSGNWTIVMAVFICANLACNDSNVLNAADNRGRTARAPRASSARRNSDAAQTVEPVLTKEQLQAQGKDLKKKILAAYQELGKRDAAAAEAIKARDAAITEKRRLEDEAVSKLAEGRELTQKLDKLRQASEQLAMEVQQLQEKRRALSEQSSQLWKDRRALLDKQRAADTALQTALDTQTNKIIAASRELPKLLRAAGAPESDLLKQRARVMRKLKEQQ